MARARGTSVVCVCVSVGNRWVGVGARAHTGMSVAWVGVGAGTHDVCRCVHRDCSSGSGVGGGEMPSRLWPRCPGLQTLLGSLFAAQGLEQMDAGVPRGQDGWVQRDGWAWACPGAEADGRGGAQGPGRSWSSSVSPLHGLRASLASSHPEALSPACSNRLYHLRYFWVGLKLFFSSFQVIFSRFSASLRSLDRKQALSAWACGCWHPVPPGTLLHAPPREAVKLQETLGPFEPCWCPSGAACRAEPLSAPPTPWDWHVGAGCRPLRLSQGVLSPVWAVSPHALPLLVPSGALEGSLRICRRGRLCRGDGGSPGAHPPSLPPCARGLEPATAPHPKPFSGITVL